MTTSSLPAKLTLALVAIPSLSHAAVISNFDFTGPPWTAPKENNFATFASNAPSSDSDANSVTSTLTNNGHTGGGYASFYIRDIDDGVVGVADPDDYVIFSSSDTPGVGMNLALSNATVPTNYVAFTVTPASGFETTFESISLYTGTNGAADQYNVEIRAWDGTTETSLGLINRTSVGRNDPVVANTIDFTDFTSAGTTEIRLYSYNVTVAGANGGVRFDDIVLNGTTVAVPEPSTTLLGCLSGLGLIARRRR